jgi:hypothetical protein
MVLLAVEARKSTSEVRNAKTSWPVGRPMLAEEELLEQTFEEAVLRCK